MGLTKDKSPDELDEIDRKTRQEKLKKRDWKNFDKRWYESLETSEYNDGFWGFGSANINLGILNVDLSIIGKAVGKVFDNNQYAINPNKEKNIYDEEKLRSKKTFSASNHCVLEISKEQYEKLLDDIHKDFSLTANVKPQTKQYVDYSLRYHIADNNCVTWVLNKLDSIGIEIIDNYTIPGSFMDDFSYLKSYNATFRKFQVIDSNLESIKGAKPLEIGLGV